MRMINMGGASQILGLLRKKMKVSIATLSMFLVLACGGVIAQTEAGKLNKPEASDFDNSFPTPLAQAIVLDYPWIVEHLLSRGESPNVPKGSELRITPILLAAAYEKENILKILLRFGADVNAMDDNGLSPLMYACIRGNYSITKLLVEAGGNVNLGSNTAATALMIASHKSSRDIVRLLLSHGATVNSATVTGSTSLMVAGDDAETIKLLIDAKAAINSVDKEGRTALQYAVEDGDLIKAKVLLDNGATACSVDAGKHSLLEIAKAETPEPKRNLMIGLLLRLPSCR